MQIVAKYQSPLGQILIASDEQGLVGLWFTNAKNYGDTLTQNRQQGDNSVLQKTKKWLDQYFSGQVPSFTPKLHLQGTPFQKSVWQALLQIPYGQTRTYQEIALQVNQDSRHLPIRAVGSAVGQNHIALIVPCHRVIGKNGSLTGYAAGLEKKKALLELERQ